MMATHFPSRPRADAGLTLVELLVTVAIAAIAMTLAIPSFDDAMRTNRAATLTNEFVAALRVARSEAITRGKRVVVCKSNDIATAAPTCVSAANWQNGWLVFVDDNENGVWNGTEERLRVGQPAVRNATIAVTSPYINRISFRADGTPTQAGTVSICVPPDTQRNIVINFVGRARVCDATNAATPCNIGNPCL